MDLVLDKREWVLVDEAVIGLLVKTDKELLSASFNRDKESEAIARAKLLRVRCLCDKLRE
ncbi:MAG: hypothetical protein ACTSPB_00035 [Candidatus Thorarchaeota archaeon]